MARKKTSPFIVQQKVLSLPAKRRKKRTAKPRDPQLELFTVEDAFDPGQGPGVPEDEGGDRDLQEERFHLERGVRSVAYILESATDGGNDKLDGYTATGLGKLLTHYAAEIRRLEGQAQHLLAYRQRRIRELESKTAG